MDRKIIWSPTALRQLEDLCSYIACDSEQYACIFAQRVLQLVESLPAYPKMGRIVPEYNKIDLREKLYQGYRIIYRLQKEQIEIAAICHSARLLRNALEEVAE